MSVSNRSLALAVFLAVGSVSGVAQADWYAEAESIHTNPSYPYAIEYDEGAYGDAYYQMSWNGSPGYEWFYVGTAGWYTLNVRVAGSECKGEPIVQLLIDKKVIGRHAVDAGWSHLESDVVWLNVGWHSFTVALENAYTSATCERALRYDAAWMYGSTWR